MHERGIAVGHFELAMMLPADSWEVNVPRSSQRKFVPMVLAIALISGCSDNVTGPSPTATPQASSRAVATVSSKGHRHKDHTLKDKQDGKLAFYLDEAAQVIHNDEGDERVLTAREYSNLRRDFERIASADAMYERLYADAGFKSCLAKAKRQGSGHTVRIGKPSTVASSIGFSPTRASLSLAPTGPSLLVAYSDPTFCQEVALGLYNATQEYWNARNAYTAAIALNFFSGVSIQGGVPVYDGTSAFSFAGGVTLEYFAYNYMNATLQAGIWGTWFNLGGCGSSTAQYGYTWGGSGGSGGVSLACHYENVFIEVSNDGGNTWSTWWSGSALVCA